MSYRRLGRTGLEVSSLCLGTMTFGQADETSFMYQVGCDERTAFAIMDRALSAGVSFFDTADVYGQDGLSERIIGRWCKQERRRDEIVLATKCRLRMGDGPNTAGASRYRIMRCAENSLRRLQTDHIDLYQIHMQDTDTPEEETLRALDDLVRAGKVLYIGASNYAAYRLTDSLWTAQTRNWERYATLQAQYSLIVRDIEREHIATCRRFGVGLLPWSPLGRGFLSGKYRKDAAPPAGTRLERWKDTYRLAATERNWRILETVLDIAGRLELTPAQVALAWLLARPAVTSVIIGARSVEQLDENLAAAGVTLPAEDVQQLDEVSAPELGYPYDFIRRFRQEP